VEPIWTEKEGYEKRAYFDSQLNQKFGWSFFKAHSFLNEVSFEFFFKESNFEKFVFRK
jgi:hypothetical protein